PGERMRPRRAPHLRKLPRLSARRLNFFQVPASPWDAIGSQLRACRAGRQALINRRGTADAPSDGLPSKRCTARHARSASMAGRHRFVLPRPSLSLRGFDLHKLALAAFVAATSAVAFAADDDWQAQVAQALGKPGSATAGGVYRVALPRTDLK